MPLTNVLAPSGRSAEERAAWLDAFVNRAPIGIALTVDRVLTEVNDYFCTLTGYRRSELIGQPARILYPSDDDYRRAGEAIYPQLRHQQEVRIETQLRRKDGQIINLACSIALVDPDRPELGAVSTQFDVTAQRRAEQLLKAQIALSEHAAKGEHGDLVTRVLTDAIALTQSAAARLEFSGCDQATLACNALAIHGAAGLEFSIQGLPVSLWGEQPSPQGETLSDTGGHWTPGVTGKEPLGLVPGSRLEVSALSQANGASDVRLTIGGKDGSYTPTDRAYLEQLASMAQDALGILQTKVTLRITERRARRIIGTHADITRVKEAEHNAMQAHNKLEAALASMSDAVFIIDADGNLVHMNQAFATFHRFASLTECSDRLEDYPDLLDVCRLDGTPVTLSQWALPRALRGESAVDQIYRLRRKDTGQSWVGSYNLGPIRDADDRIIGAVVTGRDITERLKAEEQRAQLEAARARTEKISRTGSWEWHIETDQVIWSDEMYRILDVDPAQGPLTYGEKHRAFPAKDNERLQRAIARTIRDGVPYVIELDVARRDGTTRQVLARGFPQQDTEGRVVALHGFIQDITERKQAERQMCLAACVVEHSLNGVVVADPDMRILEVNPRYRELTGFTKDELLGQPLARLVAGGDGRSFPETLRAELDAQGSYQTEINARCKGDASLVATLSLSRVRDAEDELQNYIAILADITALKAQQVELERLAHHDALTGLPNRRLLLDRLGQAMALADRTGRSLAVCYLDLDGFKPINDRHGHERGDQYLIAVGGILQANLRRHDSVARIGGDEFVLMLTELERPEDCYAQLDRILAAIHEPVTLDGVRHQVAASIGVTLYPDDRSDPEDLLDHADQAMYRAKQSGGSRYQFYQPERP